MRRRDREGNKRDREGVIVRESGKFIKENYEYKIWAHVAKIDEWWTKRASEKTKHTNFNLTRKKNVALPLFMGNNEWQAKWIALFFVICPLDVMFFQDTFELKWWKHGQKGNSDIASHNWEK